MACLYQKYLSPYLDGELDHLNEGKTREHLTSCVACQEAFGLMAQIRRSLKQAAASTKAPLHLKERALSEVTQRREMVFMPRWNLAYGAGLAAIVLLAFILVFHYWLRPSNTLTEVFDVLAEYHAGYETGVRPLTLRSSDLHKTESWIASRIGFKALIPKAAFAEYDLEGVDIFDHDGKKFVYLKYRGGRKIIGYMIFQDFRLSLDLPQTVHEGEIDLHMGKGRDINCAAWKKAGLVYLILTAEDRSELVEYARRCIKLF
ncbi:MAG: hypothetical protein GTN74_15635 [Proteobacteria bacterium]|nr:hypothetical protein [Pseudomonadota bacterium]NIS72050.1 hypothetical protein [Pseudomonadota bacterium]